MYIGQEVPSVEVVEPIRRSVVLLIVRIFMVLLLADSLYAGLLLVIVLGYVPLDLTLSYTVFLWVIHTAKNIAVTFAVLSIIIKWISSLYYVSDGHFIRQRGVLNIQETVFQLTDIEAVSMHQTWFGKIFDFGDVTITFDVTRNKQDVLLYSINKPEKYEKLFSKFV